MQKLITFILITVILLAMGSGSVLAQAQAGESAILKTEATNSGFDYRVENLRNFLTKFNSPLAGYSAEFVAYADANGLDYRLVPSISGVESTFGKFLPARSFNAYGWAGGNYRFTSWTNSIQIVSETLNKEYINKGAVSLAQIARRYAPPSTTWGGNVKYFVGKIDPLPLSFDI